MLGRFDFEKNSKSVFHLISTARTKISIGIAVQHQYACIVADRILRYIDGDNNKLYVKIIDDFYVIVQVNIR